MANPYDRFIYNGLALRIIRVYYKYIEGTTDRRLVHNIVLVKITASILQTEGGYFRVFLMIKSMTVTAVITICKIVSIDIQNPYFIRYSEGCPSVEMRD